FFQVFPKPGFSSPKESKMKKISLLVFATFMFFAVFFTTTTTNAQYLSFGDRGFHISISRHGGVNLRIGNGGYYHNNYYRNYYGVRSRYRSGYNYIPAYKYRNGIRVRIR
ncbi:MAG: hypothetical protein LBE20_06185, partial [Deltaproteobacteria bacterium]|nr:hypothetical protein [Deltaproteobacteria bacterium]